jgi:endonuclease/exonuclease/phosphatase family metal-dependent hydrolase
METGRPLRVVSYNISHCAGIDRRLSLARTARVIRDAGVDVAGLQEVDRHFDARSDFVDQAGELARELGMHVAFGANLDLDPYAPGSPRRQFGNAILSSGPIVDWDNTHLPRSGDHEQRGLLRARVDAHGTTWQVYATHLQHDDAAERLAQAQEVARLIGASAGAAVLLVDLNAAPGTPEVRALTDRLADAWEVAGSGSGGTIPNPFPCRRIDYVMSSRDTSARRAVVIHSIRARTASDHAPVVADIAP